MATVPPLTQSRGTQFFKETVVSGQNSRLWDTAWLLLRAMGAIIRVERAELGAARSVWQHASVANGPIGGTGALIKRAEV